MENTIKFKPFNQNVLVYAPKVEKKTKSGIIKSDAMLREERSKITDLFFEVAAVSDEITDIKVGDKVLVGTSNIPVIEIDGVDYMPIHKLSIIGKRYD